MLATASFMRIKHKVRAVRDSPTGSADSWVPARRGAAETDYIQDIKAVAEGFRLWLRIERHSE